MECVSARIPYTTWRLRAFRQLLAASKTRPQTIRRGISTSRLADQLPDSTSRDITQNAESNTVPPSQRLPQSPLLMHPRHGAEKNRKRRPTTQEEADLLKNPWAVMLASPVRMCSVTAARLPSDLLGTWGLVRQPNEDKLYMMPVGLMQDSLQSKQSHKPTSSPEPTIRDQEEMPKIEPSNLEEVPFSAPMIRAPKDKQSGRHLALRIAELLPVLRLISPRLSKNSGKRPGITRLLPFRWKQPVGPISAHEEQKLAWSVNTPDIVLKGMRNHVSKNLAAVLLKYKHSGTANGVWNVLDLPVYSDAALMEALGKLAPFDRMECGAVLLLDSKDSASENNSSSDSVSLPQTGSKVPVFDLSVLLSESDMMKLRRSHGLLQSSALFFRPEEKVGIDAMIALWKIKRLLDPVGFPENPSSRKNRG